MDSEWWKKVEETYNTARELSRTILYARIDSYVDDLMLVENFR
jgi:hypothetical protein